MSRQRGMVLYGPTLTLCWNFQRTCPMSLISPWIIRPSPPILLCQVFPYLLASMSALAPSPASEALGLSTVDSTVCDLDSTQYLAPDILDWLDDPLLCQLGSGSPRTACCCPRPSISNADFKPNLLYLTSHHFLPACKWYPAMGTHRSSNHSPVSAEPMKSCWPATQQPSIASVSPFSHLHSSTHFYCSLWSSPFYHLPAHPSTQTTVVSLLPSAPKPASTSGPSGNMLPLPGNFPSTSLGLILHNPVYIPSPPCSFPYIPGLSFYLIFNFYTRKSNT